MGSSAIVDERALKTTNKVYISKTYITYKLIKTYIKHTKSIYKTYQNLYTTYKNQYKTYTNLYKTYKK